MHRMCFACGQRATVVLGGYNGKDDVPRDEDSIPTCEMDGRMAAELLGANFFRIQTTTLV